MKIIAINICPDGSTGKIMNGIADCARKNGIEYITFSAPKKVAVSSYHHFIGGDISRRANIAFGKIRGIEFAGQRRATEKLIEQIKKEKPDILHLHNLHSYYINVGMLMEYIYESEIPVVWTLHDCWAFTGHCAHYTMAKCYKWQSQCDNCPQYKEYPKSCVDRSRYKYSKKKQWFSRVQNLTVVTPSDWLAEEVSKSFLKDKKIKVIHNGINLNIFKPTKSDFRERYNLIYNFMVLAVASEWTEKKGIAHLVYLAEHLPNNYKMVIVGTDEKTDALLPSNVISIHKTSDVKELVSIYTAADVYVNPTLEENFPTVNIEALACGTPVITYQTGGSPEIIDNSCGEAVQYGNQEELLREIISCCTNGSFLEENCLKRAALFNAEECFSSYIKLYYQILNKQNT